MFQKLPLYIHSLLQYTPCFFPYSTIYCNYRYEFYELGLCSFKALLRRIGCVNSIGFALTASCLERVICVSQIIIFSINRFQGFNQRPDCFRTRNRPMQQNDVKLLAVNRLGAMTIFITCLMLW